MSIKEKIETYSNWFIKRIEFISKIGDDETKILCCCTLMDALAKCVEPDLQNKVRFINLLEIFGSNDIWTRVSIYHLVNDPKFMGVKRNKDLATYTSKKLEWLKPNEMKNLYDVDPTIDLIQNDVSRIHSISGFIELCKTHKYSTYFYRQYRCGLVHEARILREHGSGWDYSRDNLPHYIRCKDKQMNDKKQLIFPAKFILDETIEINNEVRKWLIKQNINPYERYGLE